jgi:hypothetical protein
MKFDSYGTFCRLAAVAVGVLFLAGCGGGNSSTSTTTTTTTTTTTSNTADLTVGFGPNGSSFGYYNGVFTTVTICAPGTSNCQTIDNVLVDTGSEGLRILNSALTSLPETSLGTLQNSSDDQYQDCVQYGDTSYSWGPVWLADVELGGEKASNVAIQVIGGNAGNATSGTVPAQCLTTPVSPSVPNGGNEDTVATLGANGILGIGVFPNDCGNACTSSSDLNESGYPYYICPTGQACSATTVPIQDQLANPVSLFSSDNNGVVVALNAVGATGAAGSAGTITFGIGTQSDNSYTAQTLYAVDQCGFLPSVTYQNISYTDTLCSTGSGGLGAVFDTGSNTLYVSDATTLGISDCADNGYYCPNGTLTLSNIGLSGYNGVGSGTVSLSIANADQLLAANPTFAAFNNLGSDSGTSPSTDYFDFGAPFFLGRMIFVGIAGASVPNGASAPNGFFAF